VFRGATDAHGGSRGSTFALQEASRRRIGHEIRPRAENVNPGLLRTQHADILDAIRDSRDLDDATAGKLKAAVDQYARTFV